MNIDETEDEKNIEQVRKESATAMEIEIPESNNNNQLVAGPFSYPINLSNPAVKDILYSVSSTKT